MLKVLSDKKSIFHQFLAELRDVNAQKDSMRFRRNIERIGELFAYEISKELSYTEKVVQTPLGTIVQSFPEKPVLANVLRAGLPLHQGLLNYFDGAENAFISAYRKHVASDDSFEVKVEYLTSPDITNKTIVLADSMLATGTSMLLAYQALLTKGIPKHIHLVSVIASQQAVNKVMEELKNVSFTLWIGAIDQELNAQSYIVPGLGDAGDLSFGKKL